MRLLTREFIEEKFLEHGCKIDHLTRYHDEWTFKKAINAYAPLEETPEDWGKEVTRILDAIGLSYQVISVELSRRYVRKNEGPFFFSTVVYIKGGYVYDKP